MAPKEKNWTVEAAIFAFAFAFLAPDIARAQSEPAAEAPVTAPVSATEPEAPVAPAPTAAPTTLPAVTAHEVHRAAPKPAALARKPAAPAHVSHPHPQVRAAARHSAPAGRHASANPASTAPADKFTPNYGKPNIAQGPVTPPSMASQMTISGADLNARPVTRPGEVLEAVPGLIVTQHSGEGKANQYFLRGYNLDHGADMAIWVDDTPINLRTHAHGQGYADLNWLMPELVSSVEVRKGPYFADEGDFGSAGNLRIRLIDTTPATVKTTLGMFNYQRLFGMQSAKMGEGNLLFAGELGHYDGPWSRPDDMRKINSIMRYSQGTEFNGFTLTGMAYSNNWMATNQVPLRAIQQGEIGDFGNENPSDDGSSWRTALSARIAGTESDGAWKANAFVARSMLDLYNDFTYYLADPPQVSALRGRAPR